MIDLYQDVTDRIVAAIEAGTPPWVKPWSVSDFRPRNAKTQRPYRGVNNVLLGLDRKMRLTLDDARFGLNEDEKSVLDFVYDY